MPILRAGLGMLDPVLELMPQTEVGYLGLERNEQTAEAGLYYSGRIWQAKRFGCSIPCPATGGSASRAALVLKSFLMQGRRI